MIVIDTDAIAALRERLLERGGLPSQPLEGSEGARQIGHPFAHDERSKALFDATFELLFLMLEADGKVTDDEEEALMGAARQLTGGVVRTQQVLALANECARVLDRQGKQARLEAVASALVDDDAAAEAAFVLAAAIALADGNVAPQENDTIKALAGHLGLDDARANQLLRRPAEG